MPGVKKTMASGNAVISAGIRASKYAYMATTVFGKIHGRE